jgi:glycosyltransferase involved in cell wall biosynthesis
VHRVRARSRLPARDRRRVLILVENAPVPFDRRVRQESLALRAAGYEVVVVSPQGSDGDSEPYEVYEGIEIHRFPLREAQRAAGYLREYSAALREIRSLIRRLNADRHFGVVHACNPPDFLLAAAWPLKRQGTRLLFDHHDLSPELYESRYQRKDAFYFALRAAERLAFLAADAVITTNESYRRIAIERGKKRPEEVFVVRNAPDPAQFGPVAPDESAKRGRRHLIAYLGLMGPQDGIDTALRVLALLRTQRDDWHAVFMGDGEVFQEMRQFAEELGLADSVEFTGRVREDRILPILSAADVCISPEPSSPLNDRSTFVKVVEYMAMARPVVAFDLTETRASAGDSALYAPPGDEAAFAACIGTLLDDPEQRRALGECGHARMAGELSWNHSRTQLLRAYAALLDGDHTTSGSSLTPASAASPPTSIPGARSL